MEQVISGMRELVRQGIVHRDIKPSNIFKKGNQYKLGDLGYAISVELCLEPQRDNVGTPSFMPLESLQLN
jgi:serine/threonine-protein kinase ULK2